MKTECAAPAPATQRELVRLLYLEHGHQKASELSGVSYDLVRQWAHRGNWTPKRIEAMSQSVTKRVVDAVQSELQTHERETRLSLARSARKLATEAESAELGQSSHVLNVAKTAAVVHKWGDEKQNVSFSLNVLNLNMLSDSEPDSPGA